MIPIAVIAIALLAPSTPEDALQGRPLSWDQLGVYALKLDREDQAEIDLLRKGEGSEVRARALARLRIKPDNLVAGWIYGQTARIGKNPDEALRLLENLKDKEAAGVEYARLKTERIKLLSLAKPGDYQSAIRAEARAIWDRNPDAPEFLPLYVDILEPDEAQTILTDYASRHKPDRIVKLEMARAYLGTHIASSILDDLIKASPNDAAANYYQAFLYATTGKPKQATSLFRWLLDHAELTDPMKAVANAYVAAPKEGSLHPFPPSE